MRFYIQERNRKNNRPANKPGGFLFSRKEVILCGSWMMPVWTRETAVHTEQNKRRRI
jgi:hypothetical protein